MTLCPATPPMLCLQGDLYSFLPKVSVQQPQKNCMAVGKIQVKSRLTKESIYIFLLVISFFSSWFTRPFKRGRGCTWRTMRPTKAMPLGLLDPKQGCAACPLPVLAGSYSGLFVIFSGSPATPPPVIGSSTGSLVAPLVAPLVRLRQV